jgi:hypothetical protein
MEKNNKGIALKILLKLVLYEIIKTTHQKNCNLHDKNT